MKNMNNNTEKLVKAFACACFINEHVHNQGKLPAETAEAYFAKLDEARQVEQLAADRLEQVTGKRPVFMDQGGFLEGHGVVLFEHDGIEYEFDGYHLNAIERPDDDALLDGIENLLGELLK